MNVFIGVSKTTLVFFIGLLTVYALYLEARKNVFPRIARLLATTGKEKTDPSSSLSS